jgi:hypothetical protein
VLTLFDNDFLTSLEAALSTCPNQETWFGEGYSEITSKIFSYIACVLYSSLSGLAIATIYFVFKPAFAMNISRRRIISERIQVFLMFLCTFVANIGLLSFASLVFEYNLIRLRFVCTSDPGYIYYPGISFVASSVVITFLLNSLG